MFDMIDKDQDGVVNKRLSMIIHDRRLDPCHANRNPPIHSDPKSREMIIALRKHPNVGKCLSLPAKFKQGSEEHRHFEEVFSRVGAGW